MREAVAAGFKSVMAVQQDGRQQYPGGVIRDCYNSGCSRRCHTNREEEVKNLTKINKKTGESSPGSIESGPCTVGGVAHPAQRRHNYHNPIQTKAIHTQQKTEGRKKNDLIDIHGEYWSNSLKKL